MTIHLSRSMGLLPDTPNCGLCMRRQCWERFPRHWFQRKPLVNDPGMHHGTCVTHVPWCMSGLLSRNGGENVPGILGTRVTRNFGYLVRGPRLLYWNCVPRPPTRKKNERTSIKSRFMTVDPVWSPITYIADCGLHVVISALDPVGSNYFVLIPSFDIYFSSVW